MVLSSHVGEGDPDVLSGLDSDPGGTKAAEVDEDDGPNHGRTPRANTHHGPCPVETQAYPHPQVMKGYGPSQPPVSRFLIITIASPVGTDVSPDSIDLKCLMVVFLHIEKVVSNDS